MADKFRVNGVDLADRQLATLSNFKGVDYSNNKLDIDSSRATEILNIVYRNGRNKARYGYEQTIQAEARINNVWVLVDSSYVKRYLVHCGTKLYEAINIGDFRTSSMIDISNDHVFIDEPTSAFIQDNCLYIFSGNEYLVYDGIILRNVTDDEIAYIPTTTSYINYVDSPAEVGNYAFEEVNMLTEWRINTLVSGTWIDGVNAYKTKDFYEYTLDTNIVCKETSDINRITIEIRSL